MKIRLKKYQSGGSIPPLFTKYTPIDNSKVPDPVLNLLASMGKSKEPAKTTKSSSNSDLDDTMQMVAKMKGLDNDTSAALSVLKSAQSEISTMEAFGMSPSSALTNWYYQAQNLINKVAESKEEFKDAYTTASNKSALSEYATTANGLLVARDEHNKLTYITPEQFKSGKYKLQTNQDLLYLRRHDSGATFNNSLLDIVQSSTSMKEIRDIVNQQANKLGSDGITVSGTHLNNGSDIAGGLQILKSAEAKGLNVQDLLPLAGVYSSKYLTSSQKKQVELALNSIYATLTPNQKTLLKVHSDGSEKGAKTLIGMILTSQTSETFEFDTVYQTEASKNLGLTPNKNGGLDMETGPASSLVMGLGAKKTIILNPRTSSAFKIYGKVSSIQTKDGANLGQGATLQDVSKSAIAGVLDFEDATFGGSRIRSDAYNQLILRNSDVINCELPVVVDANGNPTNQVDMSLLEKVSNAEKEITQNNITDVNEINKVYAKYQLPQKYNGSTLSLAYKRFAAIQVNANTKALEDKVDPNQVVINKDKAAREAYVNEVNKAQGDKKAKFKLDWHLGWDNDEQLYEGVVFIPIRQDVVNSLASENNYPKLSESNQIKIQQYAPKASQYKKPTIDQSQLLQ